MCTAHCPWTELPADICPFLSLQTLWPYSSDSPKPSYEMGHTRFESGMVEGERNSMLGKRRRSLGKGFWENGTLGLGFEGRIEVY